MFSKIAMSGISLSRTRLPLELALGVSLFFSLPLRAGDDGFLPPLVKPQPRAVSVSDTAAEANFFDFWKLESNAPTTGDSWDNLRSPLEPPQPKKRSADFLSQDPNATESFTELLREHGLSGGAASYSNKATNSTLSPGRLSLSQQANLDLLKLQSKLDVPDSTEIRSIPYIARTWKAEESVNMPIPIALPVAEAMFVYGQMGSNGDATNNQTTKLTGKTGIGWKWSPVNGYEFQIRGGPSVAYADLFLPTRFSERSQMSIELQAKMALFGPLQLQYIGEALPAMTTADHDQLKQDFKLAVPFGTGNELYLGAKYRWDGPAPTTSWMDRAQVYFGLQFTR